MSYHSLPGVYGGFSFIAPCRSNCNHSGFLGRSWLELNLNVSLEGGGFIHGLVCEEVVSGENNR